MALFQGSKSPTASSPRTCRASSGLDMIQPPYYATQMGKRRCGACSQLSRRWKDAVFRSHTITSPAILVSDFSFKSGPIGSQRLELVPRHSIKSEVDVSSDHNDDHRRVVYLHRRGVSQTPCPPVKEKSSQTSVASRTKAPTHSWKCPAISKGAAMGGVQ